MLHLFFQFVLVDKLNVVGDALEPGILSGVIHDVLPVGAKLANATRIIFEDQIVVEAEVGALKHHIVRFNLLAIEWIAKVLAEKIVQLLVFVLHRANFWVEHDFLLVLMSCGLSKADRSASIRRCIVR